MALEKVPPAKASFLDPSHLPARFDAGDHREVDLAQAQHLVAWAANFGLDAWADHVCMMYGAPYVTEKGAIANAEKYQAYQGYEMRRVKGEELQDLGLEPDDIVWECAVDRRDRSHPIVEYGVVHRADLHHLEEQARRNLRKDPANAGLDDYDLEVRLVDRLSYLPLYRNPNNIARVRAIRRAHLTAFPLQGYTPEEVTDVRP